MKVKAKNEKEALEIANKIDIITHEVTKGDIIFSEIDEIQN